MFFSSVMLAGKRLLELMLSAVILSAFCVLLNTTQIVNNELALTVALIVAVIIFNVINVFLMRRCYFELEDKRLYYIANITSYIIFAALSLVAYKLFSTTVFTWIFAIVKFLHFTSYEISTPLSAFIFHLLGIIGVLAAPIGLDWILVSDEEADELFEEHNML